jgi:ATP-dependent protease HslVU (ClpYQ) peptidase subunit
MSDMYVRVTVDQDLFSMIAMIADRLDNINKNLERIAVALDKQAEEEDIMNRVMSMWIDKVKEMAGEQSESDEEEKA